MNLETAKVIAEEFVMKIRSHCERIDVVGSVRRQRPEVHDIDIVLIPRMSLLAWLFRSDIGVTIKTQGDKLIKLAYAGADIELYLANSMTYEVLTLIRTGPKEHNIKLCKLAKSHGLKLKADGTGLVTPDGNVLDNTERGILEKLLGHYVEPEEREA